MNRQPAVSRSEFDRAILSPGSAGAVLLQNGAVVLVSDRNHPMREIISAGLHRELEIRECDLYVKLFPCCRLCSELVRAASPRRVFYAAGSAAEEHVRELEAHGVELIRVE